MAIDATFEHIESIRKHPNADRLDIAMVSGYQVVCGRGEHKAGDLVFFVRDDAKLVEWDRMKESMPPSQNVYVPEFWWQTKLLNYLGNGGRVKTIKLRGEFSSGIIVPAVEVLDKKCSDLEGMASVANDSIVAEDGGDYLLKVFGVTHWEAPFNGSTGPLEAKGGLPDGLSKTDEENFQNMRVHDIPYGEKVLVTKKLDGTSCTIVCRPDGTYSICSRRFELKPELDNVWTRAAKKVLEKGLTWAYVNKQRLVLRGEVCDKSIQRFPFNHDRDVPEPTFFLYGTMLPDEVDTNTKLGLYGTYGHFLDINDEIDDLCGEGIKTVPILGVTILTKELFDKYLNTPLDWGEGVVINTRHNHFKCKSMAYLVAVSGK